MKYENLKKVGLSFLGLEYKDSKKVILSTLYELGGEIEIKKLEMVLFILKEDFLVYFPGSDFKKSKNGPKLPYIDEIVKKLKAEKLIEVEDNKVIITLNGMDRKYRDLYVGNKPIKSTLQELRKWSTGLIDDYLREMHGKYFKS